MFVKRLGFDDRVDEFDCGEKSLNDWLRNHAMANQERNLSRTFVLLDGDATTGNGEVAGYFTLAMGGVTRETLPRRFGRGLPGFEIGMALVARLAIAQTHHCAGLGRDLLVAAIERAAVAGEYAAARFIAVDPLHEGARRFYTHFGFRSIDGDALGRMFIRLDEALDAISQQLT
jgi:GNAT superfamily N-acetyltransferase